MTQTYNPNPALTSVTKINYAPLQNEDVHLNPVTDLNC